LRNKSKKIKISKRERRDRQGARGARLLKYALSSGLCIDKRLMPVSSLFKHGFGRSMGLYAFDFRQRMSDSIEKVKKKKTARASVHLFRS